MNYINELSIFDIESEEWEIFKSLSLEPSGRHSMASLISSDGQYFYVIGGFTYNGPTNEIWRFDLNYYSVIVK